MGNADYKDYSKRTLLDEINIKINSIDIVRTSRINASKRLYGYSEKWDLISLIMNVMSIGFVVVSLLPLDINKNNVLLSISAIFSLYTILIQYFLSNLNYNERALKFHYHQIQLENFVLQLKMLLLDNSLEEFKKFTEYKNIMSRYQISLEGYENHSEIDYKKAKSSREMADSIRDFSWDNIFLYVQFPILITIIIVFGCVIAGGGK